MDNSLGLSLVKVYNNRSIISGFPLRVFHVNIGVISMRLSLYYFILFL